MRRPRDRKPVYEKAFSKAEIDHIRARSKTVLANLGVFTPPFNGRIKPDAKATLE